MNSDRYEVLFLSPPGVNRVKATLGNLHNDIKIIKHLRNNQGLKVTYINMNFRGGGQIICGCNFLNLNLNMGSSFKSTNSPLSVATHALLTHVVLGRSKVGVEDKKPKIKEIIGFGLTTPRHS